MRGRPTGGVSAGSGHQTVVAIELAQNGRGAARELAGNGSQALVVPEHNLHHCAVIKCEVGVGLGHATDSLVSWLLHLEFERGNHKKDDNRAIVIAPQHADEKKAST